MARTRAVPHMVPHGTPSPWPPPDAPRSPPRGLELLLQVAGDGNLPDQAFEALRERGEGVLANALVAARLDAALWVEAACTTPQSAPDGP